MDSEADGERVEVGLAARDAQHVREGLPAVQRGPADASNDVLLVAVLAGDALDAARRVTGATPMLAGLNG